MTRPQPIPAGPSACAYRRHAAIAAVAPSRGAAGNAAAAATRNRQQTHAVAGCPAGRDAPSAKPWRECGT